MAIETWFPALLGYLIPVGLFLVAWGGVPPERARRTATVGTLALALAGLGYFAVGFAFHLGGAHALAPGYPGLEGLNVSWGISREWGLVGMRGFFLRDGADTPQAQALFVTYLPLVATAVLLPVLSASGRARGWQVAVGGLVVAAVLFPLVACWAWGGGWLAQLGSPDSIQRGHGFVDHAGSGVVYLLAGATALGALIGLRRRLPRGKQGKPVEMPPAHFPLLANLGALLFGLGWLGWSLSEPFHVAGASVDPARIAVNGLLAGAGAILASQLYCWITVGYADALMSARGAAAGFAVISAAAPFVPAWSAFVVGVLAGALLPLVVYAVERGLRLPDETAAISLGVVAGVLGLLAVPFFADGLAGVGWNGVEPNGYHLVTDLGVVGLGPAAAFGDVPGDWLGHLIPQLAGMGAIALLGLLVGWLLFLLLDLPFRPPRARAPEPAAMEAEAEAVERPPDEEVGTEDGAEADASAFAPLDLLASHESEPEVVPTTVTGEGEASEEAASTREAG